MLKEVWVIDNTWVCEPFIGGIQLGEIGVNFDLKGMSVTHITQSEFDKMIEEYFLENGHYPDS